MDTVTWRDIAQFHRSAAESALHSGGMSARVSMPELYAEREETPGEAFVRSASYTDWVRRFPAGGPTGPGTFQSDPMPIEGGFRSLLSTASTSSGALIPPAQAGLLDAGIYRPPSVVNLVSHISISSDTVEFARETAHVSAAAPVPEATALTGTSGTKPEGGITFALTTERVKTFAVWVPATRNVLNDASQLRPYMDNYLTAELRRELEDQIIIGDGSGENFLGVLNATGTQTQAAPGAGESNFDVLRKAKTLVELNARTAPTAVVLNPNDNETLDLAKINAEPNRFVADPYSNAQPPLWGMLRVTTDAVPAGTAIVADWTRAVLFDREQTNILVGTAGDDFLRNLVRVLAESRVAYGITRPGAFCIVSLN